MSPTALDAIAGELLRRLDDLRPRRLIVFGSLARGTADEHSDLDLVVVLDSPLDFVDRGVQVARRLKGMGRGVEVLAYTPREYERMRSSGNAFIEMVEREGRVIHERPGS